MASRSCRRLGLGRLLRHEPDLCGRLRRQRQSGQPRRLASWSRGRAPRQPRRPVVSRVGALAEAVRRAPPRWAPARAVGVGLPAAIEPDRGSVSPTNTQRWPKWSNRRSDGREVGLDTAGGRRRSAALPETWRCSRRLRRCRRCDGHARRDAPAPRREARARPRTGRHRPWGEAFRRRALHLDQSGRAVGRDHSLPDGRDTAGGIFRGTSGDTLGLGHTIALVAAA